ncbi:response regulator [Geodermatophilus sp. SYSU D00742]
MSDVLQVVVADDHAPTREATRAALEVGSCCVVAEAGDAAGAVAAALEHRPDVCLLDIHMPGSGITAAWEITRALPDTAVVMLTASADDDDLFDALRAGASGYLLKDMDPERLCGNLRRVLAGETVLPRRLVHKMAEEFRSRPRRRLSPKARAAMERLTAREAEILDLMDAGLSTEDIAGKLFVAPVTVRTHISSILKKLRVPDREAAVRFSRGAVDRG